MIQRPNLVTDEDLAKAASDREAFAQLYERYVERVYRWAVQHVGVDYAEDVTQEVFAKAFRAIGSFRGQSFAAWLFTIAQNSAKDLWKRRDIAGRSHDIEGSVSPQCEPMTDVDTALSLASALHTLPARQKAAIELKYFADLSLHDLARTMRISTGAAKALVHRGLCNLRDSLAVLGGK